MLAKHIWVPSAGRRALGHYVSEMRRTVAPPSSHGGVRDDLRGARLSASSAPAAQLLARFRDQTLSIWGTLGARPVGRQRTQRTVHRKHQQPGLYSDRLHGAEMTGTCAS